MANLQKQKSEALATIDSALAILNKYPNIETANTELSFNTSSNPFDMLLDAFKETTGYNALINIISRWIVVGIPPLEIEVKTLLLSNIKNLLSCSINPFISNELLRDGIVFNLEQIDITDTLKYSPTSKKGQYYYFDNKDADGTFMIADELKNSSDFNCLLWFMKNRASHREVWGKKIEGDSEEIENNDKYWKKTEYVDVIGHKYRIKNHEVTIDGKTYKNLNDIDTLTLEYTVKDDKVTIDGKKYTVKDGKVTINGKEYIVKDDKVKISCSISVKGKCKKEAGIITLQFNERSQSLTNTEGNGLSIQTPYNNCLHIFLGNTQMKDKVGEQSRSTIEKEILNYKKDIEDKRKEIEGNINNLENHIKNNDNLEKQLTNNKITREEYNKQIVCCKEILEKAINLIKSAYSSYDINEIENIKDEQFQKYLEDLESNNDKESYELMTNQIEKIKECINKSCNNTLSILDNIKNEIKSEKDLSAITPIYRPIEQNYYYDRTLIEFNTDYVMSLRLFDSKVIATQLIDNLVGLINIDLNLSYKQQLIKNEVKKMIEMIIETDSTVVDDCFFTFTNDAYNDMLEKAELNRAKLFSVNGEYNGANQINVEDILSKINDLSDDATQDGNISVIEHALIEISEEFASTEDTKKTKINAGIKFNFIENLLTNLAYVIAASILSPKVYLLILVNLHILGQETNFSLEEFIGKFKQLIAALMKMLVDRLIKYLMDELMKLLGNIAVEISVKIGVEQAEYYARLLKKCIECFRFGSNRGTLDFDIDKVNHADIISEEITQKNTEC